MRSPLTVAKNFIQKRLIVARRPTLLDLPSRPISVEERPVNHLKDLAGIGVKMIIIITKSTIDTDKRPITGRAVITGLTPVTHRESTGTI